MKLSTKGRYGLRALVDLAQYSEKAPVSINSIAARQDISERYLEQLMAKLKKAGLIKSIRGAAGGYVLSKSPSEISVGDVLRALEGDLEPAECSAYHEEGCKAADICVTKYVWKKINESINDTVDGIGLDELVAESKQVCGQKDANRARKCQGTK
ncbi:RrF2 family transcriptional regulator [Lachnoclostridium sp. An181]|mgnify:CR=1 FL=1|uniref:RrF2 family transcriptional regulator n=1 Tax=Lachnoclostridium sp. An181 TaxID=1965575 RepID=UPI000B39887E|nr:Rrf2 family transcriptional regulator [Lachnoclostridium sp. An181]OUP51228.1 AsnC family transcriptional regulator [Lachnoclostridium sp. An181]